MTSSAPANTTPDSTPGPGPALIAGIALILCAAWMFVWKGSLDGVFHFDDYSNIVDNERIRSLWPLDSFLSSNRPVGLYSFALNWHFSGKNPYAYHVVNLAIHVANGLLLFAGYQLTRLVYLRRWRGIPDPCLSYADLCVGGLISTAWVIHPLTTQAVTNIVQRYESLASFGYLGVWVGLLVFLLGQRLLGCLAVLLFAWIGLLSKEVFATAPLAVLLFDRLLTGQRWGVVWRKRWFLYGLMASPFLWFAPMVSRYLNPMRTAGNSAMGFGIKGPSSWEYLRTQPEVIWHYVGLVFWPQDLCFDYVWRIQTNPWVYLSLGGVIVGIIIAAAVAFWRCTQGGTIESDEIPAASGIDRQLSYRFSIGLASWMTLTFFFILAPTSSFVPIADLAFEHRMYLASAIIVAGTVMTCGVIIRRLLAASKQPAVLQSGVALIATAALMVLGYRTHLRNLDYHDSIRLWRSVTEASPKNPRAWYSLGQVYYQRGEKDAALQPMLRAVGYSNTPVALHDAGLAGCLLHIGRLDDAIALYKRAIENKPDYKEAYNDLGVIYLEKDQIDEARRYFTKAAELGHADASYNLGWLARKAGGYDAASRYFRKALDQEPVFPAATRQLAWLTATDPESTEDDLIEAKRKLEEGYNLEETTSSAVLDTAAVIAARQGALEDAVHLARRAIDAAQKTSEPDTDWIAEIQERLESFESGQAWLRSESQ